MPAGCHWSYRKSVLKKGDTLHQEELWAKPAAILQINLNLQVAMFKPSNKQVSVTLISILLLTYYQVKDIAEALYKIKQNKTKKKQQKKNRSADSQ